VADAIVNAVALGSLKPGQRIVEADLAAMLKVSRVPIREAIKILDAQGILIVTPNRGARVAPFDAAVIEEVFEVRLALEKIAIRGALEAYRREPRKIDALHEIVSRMERVARWNDWAEFRKCDVEFHREICRASGNEIVRKLWEAIARHITIIFGRELALEGDFQVVIDQHSRLIASLEALDAGVEDELEKHIMRLHNPAVASAREK
jgi:DNA-binding GntR family transcriptional regulator